MLPVDALGCCDLVELELDELELDELAVDGLELDELELGLDGPLGDDVGGFVCCFCSVDWQPDKHNSRIVIITK